MDRLNDNRSMNDGDPVLISVLISLLMIYENPNRFANSVSVAGRTENMTYLHSALAASFMRWQCAAQILLRLWTTRRSSQAQQG